MLVVSFTHRQERLTPLRQIYMANEKPFVLIAMNQATECFEKRVVGSLL